MVGAGVLGVFEQHVCLLHGLIRKRLTTCCVGKIGIASMTHNSMLAIKKGLKHLANHLNVGGKYIGKDWFSTCHSDYLLGDVNDEFTRFNLLEGQFFGVGNVHFSTKEHILEMFSEAGFLVTRLEHKRSISEISYAGHQFASWNFVAEKI